MLESYRGGIIESFGILVAHLTLQYTLVLGVCHRSSSLWSCSPWDYPHHYHCWLPRHHHCVRRTTSSLSVNSSGFAVPSSSSKKGHGKVRAMNFRHLNFPIPSCFTAIFKLQTSAPFDLNVVWQFLFFWTRGLPVESKIGYLSLHQHTRFRQLKVCNFHARISDEIEQTRL